MTLPDSDRVWLSFGGKYTLSKQASLDFGYSHIFFKDAKTDRNATLNAAVTTQTVRGEWNNNRADILSVQYNHTF
jgi:long-chain fatty acid transport protein